MLPQLKELLQNGTYQPAPGSVPLTLGSLEIAQAERTAKCRVILTAEQTVPYLDNLCTVIKVRSTQRCRRGPCLPACLGDGTACTTAHAVSAQLLLLRGVCAECRDTQDNA